MLLLSLFLVLFCPFALWASPTHWLAEGDQLSLPAAGPAWIENGNILRAEKSGSNYLIHALHTGHSDFKNGSQVSTISVISRQQYQTYSSLSRVIPKTFGLTVDVENGQVSLLGNLIRFSDWLRLSQECLQRECHYKAKIKVSSSLQKELRREFENQMKQIAAFPYRLEFAGEIRMFVPEKIAQLRRIQDLMGRYGIQVIPDSSSVEILPLVQVQITIAEVKRSEMLSWGIHWPSSYEAQLIPGTEQATNPLTLALSALESSGIGRVLASPNLLCRSGKEAEFVAGGEIPIKIINSKVQDIVWKRYGILLKVKPVADFSGRMSISVETEVSSLDEAHKVDGIPGIFTNRVHSHFDLSKPQTILLSGLLKKDSSENSSGLPGLQNIPILGSLFGSKDYQSNRSELMIFVRPEIVSTESAGM